MSVSLSTLAKGKGPYTEKQIKQVDSWLKEDWEAADHDRELLKVVRRLHDTVTFLRTRIKEEHEAQRRTR